MYVVYVLNQSGKPLMPTRRFGHVRRLLKSGMAKAVSTKPFIIRLQYISSDTKQPLHGATDPGRTNIGEAVINDKGEVVYAAHVASRNKEIPKLMENRASHRSASRRGERLRRKRRAEKNGTTTEFPNGRKLPGYEDGVLPLKDIINTEAKFNNRRRPAGWLTPTARQCVQTHLSMVRRICKFLPITDWTMEYNRFAFMQLEDGTVRGWDFQNGRLKGYASKEDYVSALQDGRCALCGKPIEHYHHILPKRKGGSDTPENLVGLCASCHAAVHARKKSLSQIGRAKKYAGTSIVNTAMPFIWDGLVRMFGEDAHICEGQDTADARKALNVPKEHFTDAVCIAGLGSGIMPRYDDAQPFELRQFRNHDRALIKAQTERTYRLDGKIVARNRKPRFEQKGPALSDWFDSVAKEKGEKEAMRLLSKLEVSKSQRRYNNLERHLPGSVFLYKGKRYVMQGQRTNGNYLIPVGHADWNLPRKQCTFVGFQSLAYI